MASPPPTERGIDALVHYLRLLLLLLAFRCNPERAFASSSSSIRTRLAIRGRFHTDD